MHLVCVKRGVVREKETERKKEKREKEKRGERGKEIRERKRLQTAIIEVDEVTLLSHIYT